MDFELVPALIAGLTGTVAMTAMMMMGKSMGMTSMDIALITDGMMTDDEAKARKVGMMIHIVMMGTIVFGIAYTLLFQAFDSTSAATGLLIGAIHGIVVGAMAMPMMGVIHPRMQAAGQGVSTLTPPGSWVSSTARAPLQGSSWVTRSTVSSWRSFTEHLSDDLNARPSRRAHRGPGRSPAATPRVAWPSSRPHVPQIRWLTVLREPSREDAKTASSARGWLHGPGAEHGVTKLIVDADKGVLIGASTMGPRAGDVIGFLGLAVKEQIPISALKELIYPYPTFVRGVEDALGALD